MDLTLRVVDFEDKIPYNVVVSWENGSRPIKEEEVPKLIEALNLPPDVFEPHKEEFYKEAVREKYGRRVDGRLNKRIKDERIRRNLTQSEMAERIGVFPSHWSKIEMNDTNPTYEQLKTIVKLFGWDWEYAMTGKKRAKSHDELEQEVKELLAKLAKTHEDMEIFRSAAKSLAND